MLAHAQACPRITMAFGHLIMSFQSKIGLAPQHHTAMPQTGPLHRDTKAGGGGPGSHG